MVQVTKTSAFTGVQHTMDLPTTQEKIDAWASGRDNRLVQQVFPELSADQREFLMTGVTQEEWDKYMREPDEEGDDGEGEDDGDDGAF